MGNTSIENACEPVGEYLVQNSNHSVYLGLANSTIKFTLDHGQ